MVPGTTMDDAALYRLMTWLSPSYPVGAYTYSHGIEYAVEAGLIGDADGLREWIATILRHGAGQVDGVTFAAAHECAGNDDIDELARVCEFAAAFRATAETALESTAQGRAFLSLTADVWATPVMDRLTEAWNGPVVYPVAVAVASAGHGIALRESLLAYLHAFAANLVSAGLRLIPLGQSDGQRVVRALEPVVGAAAETALNTPMDELGTAAPMVDICSMKHETQYTRLFRS